MHNVRERVRESGSNANTEICFEIRAHSSTSPPSHRRISTNSSTQDFPHREPPLRTLGTYNREYTTPLSNKYNLSLEARRKPIQYPPLTRGVPTNSITSTLREMTLSQTMINLSQEGLGSKPHKHNHLTLEGFQHNFHDHLYTRGIPI